MSAVKEVLARAELKKVLEEKTEGKFGSSAGHTANDIMVGSIGGGLIGSVFPKAGFLAGLVLCGVGYYKNVPWLPAIGIGMSAASLGTFVKGAGFSVGKEAGGVAGAWERAKERMSEFKDGLLSVTFIEKLLPGKSPEKRQFAPPELMGNDIPLELTELGDYHDQLISSAVEHENNQKLNGSPFALGKSAPDLSLI